MLASFRTDTTGRRHSQSGSSELSSLSSCLAFWFYLTGKTLRTTAFQACTSDLFFTEALAHPFLCTTFDNVFSQPTSSEFAGFISTQTVGSAWSILWHFKQLPRQAGSMSSQALQRGHETPVACPEGAVRGQLQLGQTRRSMIIVSPSPPVLHE